MKNDKLKLFACLLLSFLIPIVIMIASLAGLGIVPFGDKSLVISDGNGLYINYLGYVGRAITGQEGILFSFEKGLGGNMMGSWGWFLLNPFFVLFAFADVTNYMATFTWVSVLSFSICGLTMYIFLNDLYGLKISNLVFSTAYALNGFLVANVFQMNFFSVIPVLPVMVLGLRRIVQNRSPIIYFLAIAYSLIMNFYFGFMICVISLLLFSVFIILFHKTIYSPKIVAFKYVITSFLAGITASVVWLPALLSLKGGRLDQSIANVISFKENMPFIDMFSKLFTGANSVAELSNGLPNIFVGILPVFLVILYFMDKEITRKHKIMAAVLLGFYLLSFYLVVFNIVMHGGTVTNWFNYRDSFVFCFIVLMIAAEEWQHILNEPEKNFKRSAAILLVAAILVFSKQFEYIEGGFVVIDLLILILMYLPYRMYKKDPVKNPKHTFEAVVLVMVCVNLFLNYTFSTKNILEWTNKVSDYQKTVTPVSAMIEAVHNSDSEFYRMEIGEQRSGNCGNDPMLYGYYGVGHGGSDDRDFVRASLSKLGVHRFNMRNNYGEGITSATDILLGLKYIISKEDLVEEKGYEKLIDVEDWHLYKNPRALPVAILSNNEIEAVEPDLEDVFENLNNTWSAMTGNNKKIFIEEDNISFSTHNVTDPSTMSKEEAASVIASNDKKTEADKASVGAENISASEDNSSESSIAENESDSTLKDGILKEKPDNMNYIKYTWTASRDGAAYSYNRSAMTEDNGSTLPALNYEGYHKKGDKVTSYIPVINNYATEDLLQEVAGRFKIAYFNSDVLNEMSDNILGRPSTIEKIKDSHLKGEFTSRNGQTLIFTIPYDEGWSLTVDGKKTELKKVLGVFMEAAVGPGAHTYEMRFIPVGLMQGAAASIVSLLLFIAFVVFDIRKRSSRHDDKLDDEQITSDGELGDAQMVNDGE